MSLGCVATPAPSNSSPRHYHKPLHCNTHAESSPHLPKKNLDCVARPEHPTLMWETNSIFHIYPSNVHIRLQVTRNLRHDNKGHLLKQTYGSRHLGCRGIRKITGFLSSQPSAGAACVGCQKSESMQKWSVPTWWCV